MSKKIKGLISIFLSFIVIASLATTAFAVEPRYSDTSAVIVQLLFSGTSADCSVKIYGKSGTKSITDVNITLTDSDDNVVEEWKNLSSNGSIFSFSETASDLTKGKKYKLSVSANVNGNSSTEFVSNSTTQTCPKN